MKKVLLGLFLSLGVLVAQPRVEPGTVSVTFDLAKDTLVQLPEVKIVNPTGPAFVYNTVLNNFQQNVLVWPPFNVVQPGNVQPLSIAIAGNNLTVGTYNIPVSFVQTASLTNPFAVNFSVSLGITLNVIDSRTFVTSTDQVIPHIASGEGWTTTVKLSNTSSSVSLVSLKFYDQQGNNVPYFVNNNFTQEYSVVVPANGTTDVKLYDPFALKTGSIEMKPIYGTGVTMQAVYSNDSFEATVQSSVPNKDMFNVSFDSVGRRSTGLALVNYLNYPQDVTLTFYDASGNLFYVNKIFVSARGQVAVTLDNVFPVVKNKTGTVRVTSPRPGIAGFGLKFNLDKGYFTTSPVF